MKVEWLKELDKSRKRIKSGVKIKKDEFCRKLQESKTTGLKTEINDKLWLKKEWRLEEIYLDTENGSKHVSNSLKNYFYSVIFLLTFGAI